MTIPIEEWPPELKGVINDMHGNPINVHKLMANNPSLLNAWWAFRNHSVMGGTLGQRKAELLILRVALHTQCWYEWGAHVDRALKEGIDRKEIFELLEEKLADTWSEDEHALILATDELSAHHQISRKSLVLLNRHFGNDQIMDLIAIHGMYLILAAMINTWGLALDEDTQERISNITSETDFNQAAQRFKLTT